MNPPRVFEWNPESTPGLKIDEIFYLKTNASKMKNSENQWMVFEKTMDGFLKNQ
jgi:hypothetical protein